MRLLLFEAQQQKWDNLLLKIVAYAVPSWSLLA